MTTCVFSGQGSQVLGMGAALFPRFSNHVELATNILGYDVATLCLQDPNKLLNNTQYTQPALYLVNALTYLKRQEETAPPNFAAGHSLGELNALFAAGAFDFTTGLHIVKKRAELMSQAHGGKMAAVIGLQEDKIREVLQQPTLRKLTMANYNSFQQIVVSGPEKVIESAKVDFIRAGARLYIPLNLSGAFHSPMMQDASEKFEHFLQDFTFSPLRITVIANISGKPYTDDIASNLAAQITEPVLWTQTISYLLAQGETEFEEIGPQYLLTGLIQRIKKGQ